MRASFLFTNLITLSTVLLPAAAAGTKARRCAIRGGSRSSSPSLSTPTSSPSPPPSSNSGTGISSGSSSGSGSNSPSGSSSGLSSKAPKVVQSGWFAGYHDDSATGHSFNVDQVSWNKYSHMTYAFAVTTSDPTAISISSQDEQVIPEFVSAAHAHNVTVSISVGGWTGSRFFSTAVSSPENRSKFVTTLSQFAQKWGFDGLDFDWEYPNKQGIGCNTISPQDSQNFLSLLQLLRSTPATRDLILSAAVSITPFASSTGAPMTDVSAFAKVLDFIEMMNYDIWGSWSSAVGPNAPLDDSCAPAADQQGSATSGVKAWTAAGMPANQIVLAVPAYGHSFSVSSQDALQGGALVSFPPFNKNNQPAGDNWDGAPGTDICGNATPQGGVYTFWGMIANGFLTSSGQPAQGIDYRFDTCSQTAYVYNPTKQVMISFDDPHAFTAKGGFIKTQELRGFSMWEAGGDSGDILLDAIRSGM